MKLINAFLKSRMLESIGGWGSTYKRVLEVVNVGIDRRGGGGQLRNASLKSRMLESIGGWGQLINAFLKSRMLESIGGWGSNYRRILEVGDVEIDMGGGQLIDVFLKSRMLKSIWVGVNL